MTATPIAALAVALCGAVGTSSAAVKKKMVPDTIEGTVTSGKGKGTPEAGVWVIAQTRFTKAYRKIVVTDGRGRFVLPTLPKGKSYKVWVRGYGLRDSKGVRARPGAVLNLRVAKAANKVQAAKIYPSNYWLSLFRPPTNTAALPGARTQVEWMSGMKLGCMLCHQVGSLPTRHLGTREAYDHGTMKTSTMYATSQGLGRDALLDALADWSGRIQAGETPKAPPRPRGAERNVVITQWSWGDKWAYAHDEVATDRNNPRRNANGPVYGVDIGNDRLLMIDPKTNKSRMIDIPTNNGWDTAWCSQTFLALGATTAPAANGFCTLGSPAPGGVTPYAGAYHNPANPHNPMMDAQGRVWITTQIRREWAEDLPAFCKTDPIMTTRPHHRQLGYYDPRNGKFQLIDTCYGTHHLQFDKNGVLWSSGDSFVLGWFDPAKYDPSRPETLQQAQGYKEVIVDSNGDGAADLKVPGFNYGIIPNPVDGSVWTAQPGTGKRGLLTRYDPATGKFESYIPPAPGYGPRGVDVDSKGIIWASMGGSGHLGRFDRSKCKQTWGDGNQCAEGWTFYKSPGPSVDLGTAPEAQNSADMHYYLWADTHNTLGMGKDTIILCGTNSDSLLAFNQKTNKWTVLRIPYPLNAYMRGLDGRIDNPKTGWKGRGLWMNDGLDPVIHNEVQHGWVGHIQMRPNPLAK